MIPRDSAAGCPGRPISWPKRDYFRSLITSKANVQEEPVDDDELTEFITAARLSHRHEDICSYIIQGARDVTSIMTRPSSNEQLQQSSTPASVYTPVVTGIMWYLMSLAVQRNQGFVEGAFVCRDPHRRLAAYFRSIGMPRISSHLKRHSSPGCTGGVDLVASKDVPPLPYGHRHVLFIVIEGNRFRDSCLFLKPERHGVASLGDKFFHAVSWTRSMIFRCCGLNPNNNSVPTRKERIPIQLVQAFADIVADDPDGVKVLAEVGAHDAGEGIACMHDYLTRNVKLLAVGRDGPLPPLHVFLQQLESTYDSPAVRFGNEVFLDLSVDP